MSSSLSDLLRMLRGTSFGRIGGRVKTADIMETYIEEYLKHCDRVKALRRHIFEELTKLSAQNFGVFDQGAKKRIDQDRDLEGLREATKRMAFGPENIKAGSTNWIEPSNLKSEIASLVLLRLGFISVDEGKIIPGWQRNAGKFLPNSIDASLSALNIAFDDPDLRRIYLKRVNTAENLERGVLDFVEEKLTSLAKKIQTSVIREAECELRRMADEEFIDYGNSTLFYAGITPLYTKSSGTIFVFSTTSGLAIPLEYSGDETQGKDEYRRKYFEQGIKSGLANVYYQWDAFTTGKELWKWMGEEENVDKKRQAVNILASFLKLPHLELSEADFSKGPRGWKKYFTLVSPGFNVVFSVRDDMRKISHGLLANPNNKYGEILVRRVKEELKAEGDSVFDVVSFCYKAREKRVLKPMGEVLDEKQAMRRAEEIIDHLMKIGRQQSEKNRQEFPEKSE